MIKKNMNTTQSSDYLKEVHGFDIQPSTLNTYRSRGGGPMFNKIGRGAYYTAPQLDEWIANVTQTVSNTAQVA